MYERDGDEMMIIESTLASNSKPIKTNLGFVPAKQKYDLKYLPQLNECSWVLEQYFLRHIKVGYIPNLEAYLENFSSADWTCLLAYNPRDEFLCLLSIEMQLKLDWDFILEYQPDLEARLTSPGYVY